MVDDEKTLPISHIEREVTSKTDNSNPADVEKVPGAEYGEMKDLK